MYGSTDPDLDPYQNVSDPEHWKKGEKLDKKKSWIQYKRKTNLGHFCSGYINISAGHANTSLPSSFLFFT
jgi:hypothetical protein